MRLALPRMPKSLKPSQPPAKSLRLSADESGRMPTDMGLLPATFIRPTGANRPSILNSPKEACLMQYTRVRRKVADFLTLLIYKIQSKAKPRPKLGLRKVIPTAKALHREMYTAVASGSTQTINRICADGLRDTLLARIGARGKNEKVEWELVRYLGIARCVSHRVAILPRNGWAIRQAVVRLKSRQRLTRSVNGKVVQGSGKEKDLVEYLVLQKMAQNHIEGEWIVWGTTRETTWNDVEQLRKGED